MRPPPQSEAERHIATLDARRTRGLARLEAAWAAAGRRADFMRASEQLPTAAELYSDALSLWQRRRVYTSMPPGRFALTVARSELANRLANVMPPRRGHREIPVSVIQRQMPPGFDVLEWLAATRASGVEATVSVALAQTAAQAEEARVSWQLAGFVETLSEKLPADDWLLFQRRERYSLDELARMIGQPLWTVQRAEQRVIRTVEGLWRARFGTDAPHRLVRRRRHANNAETRTK